MYPSSVILNLGTIVAVHGIVTFWDFLNALHLENVFGNSCLFSFIIKICQS